MARLLSLLSLAALVACSGPSGSELEGGAALDASTVTDAGSEPDGDAGTFGDGGAGSSDAGGGAQRRVYTGSLDSAGNATISVPEISLAAMPLSLGYVLSTAYAEPGYVVLGNIIPGEGTFRFAAGASNANANYRLVVLDAARVEVGVLDADGNAALTVPEVSLANMPLILGYVFSTAYAEPGYVALGNIIPGNGTFRFAAGSSNANAPFILVIAAPEGHATGTLDSGGNATQTVSAINLDDMPAVIGHVSTAAYAEPGFVMLGNIIPADGTFRFAAGAGNASSPFIVTWAR